MEEIVVRPTTPKWAASASNGLIGQGRTAQDWTGQDRTGKARTGQDRTGKDRTGQDRTGQDRTGQDTRPKHACSLQTARSRAGGSQGASLNLV